MSSLHICFPRLCCLFKRDKNFKTTKSMSSLLKFDNDEFSLSIYSSTSWTTNSSSMVLIILFSFTTIWLQYVQAWQAFHRHTRPTLRHFPRTFNLLFRIKKKLYCWITHNLIIGLNFSNINYTADQSTPAIIGSFNTSTIISSKASFVANVNNVTSQINSTVVGYVQTFSNILNGNSAVVTAYNNSFVLTDVSGFV